MPRTAADDVHPVMPGCEPWSAQGTGPHGALVLHGFTGNPTSMRGLAAVLHDAGFSIEMPRLPGHGTHVDDLAETGWDDWLTEADRALVELQRRLGEGGRLVVVGLSMGGALTVALAQGHPDLAGIVLINTPVTVPKELAEGIEGMLAGGLDVIDSIGGDIADPEADEGSYDATPLRSLLTMVVAGEDVRARLGEVRCPALVITSRQDHVVHPESSDILEEELGGPVERLWLENSYHVATLDHDRAEVEQATVDFARRVTSA